MSSRRREPRIEESSSWRLVEGENESFDTTLLPSLPDEDEPLSSGQAPASSGLPTQPSQDVNSQGLSFASQGLSFASQDSIRDFSRHQDDDNVILREPFRPSLNNSARNSYNIPEPQFKMPVVDVDGPSRDALLRKKKSSGRGLDDRNLRQRFRDPPRETRGERERRESYDDLDAGRSGSSATDSGSSMLWEVFAWSFDLVKMAGKMAKKPLAFLLAIYISLGAIIMAQNMITESIFVSLSPICKIPGVPLLNLPFCPTPPPLYTDASGKQQRQSIEFDDLMGVQAKFEHVLEKHTQGVSLPYEMKRSEATIRDLRTLVRNSDLQSKDELSFEFDGYIDAAGRAVSQLSRFNVHVGGAVDAVLSINRWTSRYIESLTPSADDPQPGALSKGFTWLFSPFQPPDRISTERLVLNKYIEHTAFVSDKISSLILEAQHILATLESAESFLSAIHEVTARSADMVIESRDRAWWDVLSRMSGSNAHRSFQKQLGILSRVDAQRSTAVAQVSALILELENIQAGLSDLRDRVSGPELLGMDSIPLVVHIETINSGVDRLEDARRRLRAEEEERVKDALSRGGVQDERNIEGRMG
ncbi:hypothetical protein N3K66_005529 [Trichothecium roseum]|uniref:Uncharacterized protein n=1 Tax=Trichothecium roseum TaxID=47278 RepID=A0ACC0UY66_9HYPO|nr:hypothetical protein N3K66_005529 [Trichothecium roseum]